MIASSSAVWRSKRAINAGVQMAATEILSQDQIFAEGAIVTNGEFNAAAAITTQGQINAVGAIGTENDLIVAGDLLRQGWPSRAGLVRSGQAGRGPASGHRSSPSGSGRPCGRSCPLDIPISDAQRSLQG